MAGSNLKRACSAIVLALVAVLAPADARERWFVDERGPNTYAPRSSSERRISLEQAVERVHRATGGRVLDARPAGDDYRVKVLTRQGEVRVVYVDGRTGQMR
jgi:uncharacterized membrane protein YkoI